MLQGNFFTVSQLAMEPGSIKALLEIDPTHAIFEGHFPDAPVVPGVCMIQMVKEMIEQMAGAEIRLLRADHIKFLSVIDPRVEKTIWLEANYTMTEDKKISVTASIRQHAVICFKFKGLFLAP